MTIIKIEKFIKDENKAWNLLFKKQLFQCCEINLFKMADGKARTKLKNYGSSLPRHMA